MNGISGSNIWSLWNLTTWQNLSKTSYCPTISDLILQAPSKPSWPWTKAEQHKFLFTASSTYLSELPITLSPSKVVSVSVYSFMQFSMPSNLRRALVLSCSVLVGLPQLVSPWEYMVSKASRVVHSHTYNGFWMGVLGNVDWQSTVHCSSTKQAQASSINVLPSTQSSCDMARTMSITVEEEGSGSGKQSLPRPCWKIMSYSCYWMQPSR